MTAAMQLPGGCHRLAGVLLPLAAGLHLSLGGFSLLHEAPAAWDTSCRHTQCAEGLTGCLLCMVWQTCQPLPVGVHK